MRTLRNVAAPPLLRRPAVLLAAALLAAACSTSGTSRPDTREVRDERGFRITQEVRVPSEVRVDFENALRLLAQAQYDAGIELLVKVTEAAPQLATAHINLAVAYRRTDDLERAKASIERALELSPRHPMAHNELGILQRRMGRFKQARRSYEAALEAYPDFHFARRNLAILCDVYLADRECALRHYQLYLEAVPEDEAAAIWIADLRARTED